MRSRTTRGGERKKKRGTARVEMIREETERCFSNEYVEIEGGRGEVIGVGFEILEEGWCWWR